MAEKKASNAPIDRVVMVTRNPDGSPKQEGPFEVIGDKANAVAAAAEQLGQIAVSNEDHARARAEAADTATAAGPSLSPEEEERVKRHQDLMTTAAKQAEAEIGAVHSGEEPAAPPLERSAPAAPATAKKS